VLSAGIREAEQVGVFAVELGKSYQIVEWNTGMGRATVPAWMALAMELQFVVEELSEELTSLLKTCAEDRSSSRVAPEQEMELGVTLNFMQLCGPEDRRMRLVPIKLERAMVVRRTGQVVMVFWCDTSSSKQPSLPAQGAGPSSMDGCWTVNHSIDSMFVAPEEDMEDKALGLCDAVDQHLAEDRLNWYNHITSMVRTVASKVGGCCSFPSRVVSRSWAEQCFRAHFEWCEEQQRLCAGLTIQTPPMLGGYKFPFLFKISFIIDGMVHKIKGSRNVALVIMRNEKSACSNVRDQFSFSTLYWHYSSEEDFQTLVKQYSDPRGCEDLARLQDHQELKRKGLYVLSKRSMHNNQQNCLIRFSRRGSVGCDLVGLKKLSDVDPIFSFDQFLDSSRESNQHEWTTFSL